MQSLLQMSLVIERCEMVGLGMTFSIAVCLNLNTDNSGKQSELKVLKDHPNEKNHFSYQSLKVLGIEFVSMTLLLPLTTSDQIWRVGINFKWWCSRHSSVIKCEGWILISNGKAYILGAHIFQFVSITYLNLSPKNVKNKYCFFIFL